MKVSKQAKRESKALFRSCVANGMLEEGRVRQAVQRVLEIKPRGYLAILSHFQRLVKLDAGHPAALKHAKEQKFGSLAMPQTNQKKCHKYRNYTEVRCAGLTTKFSHAGD